MNIAMFTNTFIPHVGGVANSVKAFSEGYRQHGHRVLIIAPEFYNMPPEEQDVIRVPAIRNFNGSGFSVSLPVPLFLKKKIKQFQPDVIHSHHPFWLGETALRISALLNVPLVCTHHTMHEQYTHYIPGNSATLQYFIIELSTGYENLCEYVIAPSESVAGILRKRGVLSPIAVIPTGVDIDRFAQGDGLSFRIKKGIPADAFVIGYLGRLAQEKNLDFWAAVVTEFIKQFRNSNALVIGTGAAKEKITDTFIKAGIVEHLHFDGVLARDELVNAYQAMNVFLFSSKSETQGMVLIEAMAAGIPVVALDAPGAREVIKDNRNGQLLKEENIETFVRALSRIAQLDTQNRQLLIDNAKNTAREYSLSHCIQKALDLYQYLVDRHLQATDGKRNGWPSILRRTGEEWNIWSNRFSAVGKAVFR